MMLFCRFRSPTTGVVKSWRTLIQIPIHNDEEEPVATGKTKLDNVLENVQELEDFLHTLLPTLDEQKLRHGDSVLPYAKALKLKIPESLRGLDITWEADYSPSHAKRLGDSISLVRPGHANAVGITIKCVRVGKWRICLECGWIWCRIVVSRRF
jgi:hypothetical protein